MIATRPDMIPIATAWQRYDTTGALGESKAICIRIGENAGEPILVHHSLDETA